MRKFISILAATAAVLVGLSGTGSAAAAKLVLPIVNVGSQDGCLDLKSYNSGTPVTLFKCNGAASQQWDTPGDYTIRNNVSRLCMDLSSYNTGAVVHMRPCHGGQSQKWVWGLDSTVYPAGAAAMCMDLKSYTNGTPVTLYPCGWGVLSQQWS